MSGASVSSALEYARERGEDVAALARLTRDLPGFLRNPFSPNEARVRLQHQIASREQRFLAVVERAIYGHGRSPYLKLLRQAGCELGDVRALVRRDGLEGALATLADRGVYVTFDEMKGRCETVRGSQRFRFRDRDFDSPLVRPLFSRSWRTCCRVASAAAAWTISLPRRRRPAARPA